MFHVDIKEGKNIVRNRALKRLVGKLTVYAYKEETVQKALQRDGRFHDAVFTGHELLRRDTENTMELSAEVDDDLNDVTVKIQPSCQPDSQPQSLVDGLDGFFLESQSSSQPDSQPQSLEDDAWCLLGCITDGCLP